MACYLVQNDFAYRLAQSKKGARFLSINLFKLMYFCMQTEVFHKSFWLPSLHQHNIMKQIYMSEQLKTKNVIYFRDHSGQQYKHHNCTVYTVQSSEILPVCVCVHCYDVWLNSTIVKLGGYYDNTNRTIVILDWRLSLCQWMNFAKPFYQLKGCFMFFWIGFHQVKCIILSAVIIPQGVEEI